MTVDDLNFDKGDGLVTVVAQDAITGAVLMVAYMDREAFAKTVDTGEMHYRSRSRGLWHKGATSGNIQCVVSLTADCDGDALLARVRPAGPACHTGEDTCFGDALATGDVLSELARTIESRMSTLERLSENTLENAGAYPSYTRQLLSDRNLRLKKLGEETAELIVALADADTTRATEEGADLIYHALVALRAAGVTINDVRNILAARTSPV